MGEVEYWRVPPSQRIYTGLTTCRRRSCCRGLFMLLFIGNLLISVTSWNQATESPAALRSGKSATELVTPVVGSTCTSEGADAIAIGNCGKVLQASLRRVPVMLLVEASTSWEARMEGNGNSSHSKKKTSGSAMQKGSQAPFKSNLRKSWHVKNSHDTENDELDGILASQELLKQESSGGQHDLGYVERQRSINEGGRANVVQPTGKGDKETYDILALKDTVFLSRKTEHAGPLMVRSSPEMRHVYDLQELRARFNLQGARWPVERSRAEQKKKMKTSLLVLATVGAVVLGFVALGGVRENTFLDMRGPQKRTDEDLLVDISDCVERHKNLIYEQLHGAKFWGGN